VLFAAAAAGGCAAAQAVELPPIAYSGEFVNTARVDRPEDAGEVYQLGSSARIGANTYLWQPWFSTLDGDVQLSQLRLYVDEETDPGNFDTSSTLVSGRLNLNVFPRSRFPFLAFVSVDDNRQDLDSEFPEQRDQRRLRYGIRQLYRPLDGRSDYSLRLERQETSSGGGSLVAGDFDQATNRLDLGMNYRLDRQRVNAQLNVQQTDQRQTGIELLDVVGTLQHNYRPSDSLTIDNFASYSTTDSEVPGADGASLDSQTDSAQLSSFLSWNPRDSKLSMTGDLQLSSLRTDVTGQDSSNSHRGSGSVTARYEWTPSLRLTGTVAGGVTGGDLSSDFTSQSATIAYSPPQRPLGAFSYTRSAFASASNSTGSGLPSVRNATGDFTHGLDRTMPIGASGSFTLSTRLEQSVGYSWSSPGTSGANLGHNATLGLAHADAASTSRLTLGAQDRRDVLSDGAGDTSLQNVNLQAQHDRRFGRFSSLALFANLDWTRQSFAVGRARTFPASSLSVRYRHSRFFGVRRLLFTSELTSTSASLTFFGTGREDVVDEQRFENHLYYTIGRVDAELEITMTRSGGFVDTFAYLQIRRRFAGVL
jgi:hypothetical protein